MIDHDGLHSAYAGREQSRLKHAALDEYLMQWAMKLGSLGRRHPVTLWYCDVFAGPWESHHEEYEDTSIHRGLATMSAAVHALRQRGFNVRVGAIFVERSRRAFKKLRHICDEFDAEIEIHLLHGRFQDHVGHVDRLIGSSPAFIFIDPTGWKETPMEHVATICRGPRRDVLIRVPSEVARFRHRDDDNIRGQLLRFFDLESIAPGTSEDESVELYCERLRERCRLGFTAWMAVPAADRERVACWLVVGGRSPEVLRVFRRVEQKVVGRIALRLREESRHTKDCPAQQLLFDHGASRAYDRLYESRWRLAHDRIPQAILRQLRDQGAQPYDRVWQRILQEHHIAEQDLAGIVWDMSKRGQVHIRGMKERQRRVRGSHVLELGAARPRGVSLGQRESTKIGS